MIKNWNQFIREFVESESYIDAKMQELRDLVNNATDGNNIIYEWENKNDHELIVTFSTNDLAIRYDFDIDDLHVTKTAGDKIDFQTSVGSIDEGLEMIEKDIQSILGISENYQGEWASSLKWNEVHKIINLVKKVSELSKDESLYHSEDLVSELEEKLKSYDKEVIDIVIDSMLFMEYPNEYIINDKIEEVIILGDEIMNKYGTEPKQILNAYNDALHIIRKYYDFDLNESKKGRPKAQRYKGRKIPGKYLTKNPGKMKKEIDTFRGKKEYKKDWDADYTSGKGGVGKRVKTKKSAATKAYQKMFGDK